MREYIGFVAIGNGFEGAFRYGSYDASSPEQAKRKLITAIRKEAEESNRTVREYLDDYLEMKLRPEDYVDFMVVPQNHLHLEESQIQDI
jgi:hypothetical protein